MFALIVDDSRAMRSILRKALREVGIEADEAGDGREALERLSGDSDISFVLVDWNMPNMTGIEFIRAARQRPEFNHIPLIVVTSEVSPDYVQTAIEAGANEYIMKPFTAEAIIEKLGLLGISRD